MTDVLNYEVSGKSVQIPNWLAPSGLKSHEIPTELSHVRGCIFYFWENFDKAIDQTGAFGVSFRPAYVEIQVTWFGQGSDCQCYKRLAAIEQLYLHRHRTARVQTPHPE
jgi:hypothetical protein